jgi:hypothetical protein
MLKGGNERTMVSAGFCGLFVFMCISNVVEEGAYVRDCRGHRECMVGMVG